VVLKSGRVGRIRSEDGDEDEDEDEDGDLLDPGAS